MDRLGATDEEDHQVGSSNSVQTCLVARSRLIALLLSVNTIHTHKFTWLKQNDAGGLLVGWMSFNVD